MSMGHAKPQKTSMERRSVADRWLPQSLSPSMFANRSSVRVVVKLGCLSDEVVSCSMQAKSESQQSLGSANNQWQTGIGSSTQNYSNLIPSRRQILAYRLVATAREDAMVTTGPSRSYSVLFSPCATAKDLLRDATTTQCHSNARARVVSSSSISSIL